MKKTTVIATCLINCGSVYSMREIEGSIEQTFKEDFPGVSYHQWNTDLPERDAASIIGQFGAGYRINIRQLIADLM
jgi:hypothetical protein